MTDDPTVGPDPHAIEGGFFASAPDADPADLGARLADLEARYRGLIDHLPAVIYIDGAGDDDPMVDVSPGITDLLGVSREDYLREGSDWSDYIHPDDRPRVVAESEASVANEEPFHSEFRAVHADGRVVWVREDATLIHDAEGRPLYWLGIMLDVSRFVEARRDLAQMQHTYETLVEQIPAIVYQDAIDEAWTTVYVSPQITTLLGVLPEEWTGDSKLWSEMLHPDDRARAIEEVDRGIESGEPYTVEYRMIGRDGRVKWFQDTRGDAARRRREPCLHPRRDARHHRAARGRRARGLPRVPRQPHRHAEPSDVRRAARAVVRARAPRRPRCRPCWRSTSTTSS